MDSICFTAPIRPEIHIGTGIKSSDSTEMCIEGPIDADKYNIITKIFCVVTYPKGVCMPNIKTYFDGVLKKTHCGDLSKSGQFVWWTSNGWTGDVKFDLCDGNKVICSRSTKWTRDATSVIYGEPTIIYMPTIPEEPTIPVEPIISEKPHIPEITIIPMAQPPEIEVQCYIKFNIPWLYLLPGLPCCWWPFPLLPGFKKTI